MPYLIDGNNLWGSLGGPSQVREGRAIVLSMVAAFCRAKGASAILLFDGAPERDGEPEQHFGAVTVRYPPRGEDADSVVRRIIDGASNPASFVVVTSDKSLYSYCRTRGARALQAHEWKDLARKAAQPEQPGGEKPLVEDDVEGWLKRFGQ